MSWFRFTRASRKGTKGDGFLARFFSRRRADSRKRSFDARRGRVLAIDPLESRCLLSVTPSNISAVIVNQTYGAAQSTSTAHSVAVDNAGDFVVTWTRTDTYTNPAGTSFPVTDIYARYYTSTIQQVNLPTSLMTTSGTTQPTFSLRYNDQTIQQISVTGESQAPAGTPTPPQTTNISGTFVLWFNATGSDTQGQQVPTVGGGTQADTLTVNYNEIATYVDGVETEGPAAAASQIQQWLNAFAPQAANASMAFAGSDATHATVNAIDPHTFVLDYGKETIGLDQSSLLKYVSSEATATTQVLTVTSTAGSVTTVTKGVPKTVPNPVNGRFALQVGTVQTAPITFNSTNLATTATNMQTALVAAGFTGATVTAGAGTASPWTFTITFTTAEPPVQYVIPKGGQPLQASFSNAADTGTLSGVMPTVAISTLDKPFTISNIPFSQVSPTLTAQAIAGAFQAQVNSFSTGVAPVNFVTLAAQLPQNPPVVNPGQNPYTAPIYNNVGASNTANTPVTGWNPSITVQPVVTVNTSGTDSTSYLSFNLTFTSVTGTTVDAPVVVTDYTAANGGKVVGTPTTIDGVVQVPGSVAGAAVNITKQSGNEFQVNPPQPYSIYTASQAPLNSYEPSVSMDGSGDFVITWAGEVSQQLAPKNFTDIYFRMYTPVGVTPSGTTVLNAVTSDLYQQQVLTLNFGSSIPSGNTSTFKLKIGSFVTSAITFSTTPSVTAANIQNALAAQFPGTTVAATSTGNPYNFQVTFAQGGVSAPAIQYVTGDTNPLPTDMTFSAAPSQTFTGVRQVTNPTQKLQFVFTAGAPTTTGNLGAFKLQVGSFITAAISFDSSPTVTALNIQNALTAAGFAGVAVSAQSLINTSPGYYTFNVTFAGYNTPPVQYVAISPAQGGLPASVAFNNSNGDPFTVTVNANYTNPQFQPNVAMDPYGNFVVVWANQGPDESYFNDISMQCFDNAGNPLGNNLIVNQDPGNPALNYNTDTNFNPTVAIGLNSVNAGAPITDNIVVSYTTAIELPAQVTTNPNGTVYVRGYSFNPQQKQGPAPLAWNQLALANNGGNSSVSMDGQNNFVVAWQQNTDTDPYGGTSEGIYATEYQLIDWTSGAALANPVNLRPNFRVNSSSTDTNSVSIWPFNQEASDVQMTISGDIVSSFQGYAPQVSDNIAVASSFFSQYFAYEKQSLTFTFPGGVPTFNATNNQFALQVGTAFTASITFSSSATTTAKNIQTALTATLTSLGFTTAPTVTGSLSGNTYTFKVTFGAGPSEPAIVYVGALPASVTFSNSVSAPSAAQKLTFTAATVPVNGLFELTVGAKTSTPIAFDSTNPTGTATKIQAALIAMGFAGTTVAVDAASTATSFIFDVTFGSAQAAIAFQVAPTLPATMQFAAVITAPWENSDLLPYFNPLSGSASASIVGTGSPSSASVLYQDLLGSTLGQPTAGDNYTVINAIDKVLYEAQYDPPAGTPAATQTQLGRLNGILESVAGLLRGDANGIMTSQWDANSTDSQNATYSDNIVSTQRDGENQKYYLVVPYDVQQGNFVLQITLGPVVESPNDVVPPAGTTVDTPVINMPSVQGAEPGGPIDAQATAQSISAAIDAVLGGAFGEGSVNVRQVQISEMNARTGTFYQVPTSVYNAANPTSSAVSPTQYITRLNGQGQTTRSPASPYDINNAVVYELTFEGQSHDIPIGVGLSPNYPNADQQWVATKAFQTNNGVTTTTTTYAQGGASLPVLIAGDYSGVQGTPQYNPSLGLTSSGNMVVTYTDQSLQTDQSTPATDANGNLQTNIYYNSLAEATDIAGPRLIGWTDGNGVDLLNAPRATASGVNAQYMILTFDEPMLADNPATDLNSVYNTNNYQIYDNNGNLLAGAVTHVDYGLSEASQVASLYGFNNPNSTSNLPDNKWEVVLTLKDPVSGGALADGTYSLKLLAAQHQLNGGQTGLCNLYGTPLNQTGFNQAAPVNFQATVTINQSTNPGGTPTQPGTQQTDTPINYKPYSGGLQIDPAVASTNDSGVTALNGNYVVVWTSKVNGQTNIVGQMYKASGVQIGAEFQVNTTASTSWGSPAVATDAAGNFVVVWCGAGPNTTTNNTSSIFARAYTSTGQALTAQFQVDQYVSGVQQPGVQNQPRVAMSPDGTYVVTWTSSPIYLNLSNQNAVNSAIFARIYNNGDVPVTSEFQVTPSSSVAKTLSDAAIDANDNFIVTWEGDLQTSSTWGVYGNYYTVQKKSAATGLPSVWTASGVKLLNQTPNMRGSFNLSTTLDLHDAGPRVAMVRTGSTAPAGFVVAWANYVGGNYSVFAQQFGPNGTANFTGALNTASTVMVNAPQSTTGAGWQLMPAVGVDPQDDIDVTWTSWGQDNASNLMPGINDYGIYTNIYYSSASAKGVAGTNSGPFRVNATTLGNQVAPAVGFNNFEHDAIVCWVGPDTAAANTTAIFNRVIDPPGTPPSILVPVTPTVQALDTTVAVGTAPTQATFTVTLSSPSVKPVTVSYATSGGTGANYTGTSGTLTFAPGQTSATIPVNVAGMTYGGMPNAAFNLNLSAASNAAVTKATAASTVIDTAPGTPPTPSMSVADVSTSVSRTAGQAVFTVSLSNVSSKTVTVLYSTADGTAKAGTDYTASSGAIYFLPGQTTTTITVPLTAMTAGGQANKTFQLNLSMAANATLSRGSATGTVVDALTSTPVTTPSLSVADVSTSVGSTAGKAVFTVTLSAASTNTVTALFSTVDGTAKAGTDYAAASGSIYFLPGQTTTTITVPLTAMTVGGQANKTFQLNLSMAANATLSRGSATGTIVDALPSAPVTTPSLSAADVTTSVGSTAGKAVFTVTLSAASTNTVTALFSTADGTAKAGTDYTASSGAIYFLPGQTTTTITVPLTAMTAAGQANKTFQLNLSMAANATLSRGSATDTIVDSLTSTPVTTPSLSVADVSTSVGATTGKAVFTVTLSAASTNTVTALFSTADGTAKAGTDYTASSGAIYFLPGQTTTTITVPLTAMTAAGQANKTFQLNLSMAANATLSRGSAAGTIVDSLTSTPVTTPSLSAADVTTSVGSTAGKAVFTVTLSAASTNTVTALFSTADGTAKAGTDYTASSGAIYFLPGQTTTTIAVPLTAMTAGGHANKTFQLNLSTAANATLSRGSATGTIVDSLTSTPVVTPSLSVADVSTSVGKTAGKAVFTVTLSAASTNTVTALFATADGTAKAGTDYTASSGAIYFLPGQTTTTITVPLTAVAAAGQSNKTFQLNLSMAANSTLSRGSATGTIVDGVQAGAMAAKTLNAAAVDAVMTRLG